MNGNARAFSARLSGRLTGLSLAACRSVHDRSALVLAAANTAASWARARRATWDDASGESEYCEPRIADRGHVAKAETPALVMPSQQTPSIAIDQTRQAVRPTARVPLGSSHRLTDAAEATPQDASAGSWLKRWLWLPSGSVAAVALALGGTACALWLRPPPSAPVRPASAKAGLARPHLNARQQSAVAPHKPTGTMFVTSDPVGARVLVDGRLRGTTPTTVTDLAAAEHLLVLDSPSGSVRRSVIIVADETAQVAESIFAGWVSVLSAFEVAIAEGTRAIRLDDRNQVMLPPGRHELHFENRALGYEELREVFVTPGEVTPVSIVSTSGAVR